MRSIPIDIKLKAILEVIDGQSIVSVAAKYGYSRQSLALWVRRYKAGKSLEPEYRKGQAHPRSISPKVEKLILDYVIADPEASIYKISQALHSQGVSISAFGVYKVLVRHNLQVRELRYSYSFSHPAGTLFASRMKPVFRKKLIEEYLFTNMPIAAICRKWGVSRMTFYKWLARYQEAAGRGDKVIAEQRDEGYIGKAKSVIEALAKRYRTGVNHHNSIGQEAREAILEVVRRNPYFSVHKIYAEMARDESLPTVSHVSIQNLLAREGLNTIAKRLEFAGGYMPEPQVVVAPQYVPEMPIYRWRMLFAPFVTVPRLIKSSPRQGFALLATISLPLFAFVIFAKSIFNASRETSLVGMIFASVALFFGIFFFIYSLKYYASIFMVLKLAQSGSTTKEI